KQEARLRRWRRASYVAVAVAAMLLLAFGLKLQVHVQAQQLVINWGEPKPNIEATPDWALPQPLAQNDHSALQDTAADLQVMKNILHLLAARVESLDRQQQDALKTLATRLETVQYGDNQRWKATQRDMAALLTVCLGPREKDKGEKP